MPHHGVISETSDGRTPEPSLSTARPPCSCRWYPSQTSLSGMSAFTSVPERSAARRDPTAPRTAPPATPRTGSRTAPRTGSRTAPRTGSRTAPGTESRTAPRTGSRTGPGVAQRSGPRAAQRIAGWLAVAVAVTVLAALLLSCSLILNLVTTAAASAQAQPAGPGAPAAAVTRAQAPAPTPVQAPATPSAPAATTTALPAAAPAGTSAWRWPMDPVPAVVRRFEPPAQRWLPGHRGVDLACATGAAIRAAGPGVVRYAGQLAGRGVVSVDHLGGLRTTYEPVTPSVQSGQRVAAGDLLGVLEAGHDGCPSTACLHWGLRIADTYLDPLALLRPARVRLLPLHGAPAQRG